MRRREFITLLGGAAVGWPLAARAQQAERVRRIGVLLAPRRGRSGRAGARRGVPASDGAIGLDDGRNLQIDYRWAMADPDRHSQICGGIGPPLRRTSF